MRRQKSAWGIIAAAAMVILILDGKTGLEGARSGMEQCIKTVIPSLFPFLFLCSVMTDSFWGSEYRWLKMAAKKTGIPSGAECLLIAAFLGGYPSGAQAIGEAFRRKKLREKDAAHLLTFCSNAGPAFIFGIAAQQFSDKSVPWVLWGIQIASALLTAAVGQPSEPSSAILAKRSRTVSEILTGTVSATGTICGWILLFRVMGVFIARWFLWRIPEDLQILILGLLELSGGCCRLSEIGDESLRFLIYSALLSFGGLCVVMQTSSVIGELPLKWYIRGKLLQTLWSVLLSVLYLHCGMPVLTACILSIFLLWDGKKKVVDFRRNTLYNSSIITGRKSIHAVSEKN